MKFYGKIGYLITQKSDTKPGVWEETFREVEYCGDIIRLISRQQNTQTLNDDITLGNQISIIADPFAFENFSLMKYVEFMGAKWKITSAEVQFPRILLNLGGVYADGE